MEIIYRPLKDLHPNPKNPRKGSEDAIAQLAQSIKANPAFFEARPILLSDRTGRWVIIGGERRSEAAAMLGLKEVPTILLTGLTEEQEDEIMVRDNTHSGVWDEQKLKKWTNEELKVWGAPQYATFDEEEVNSLFLSTQERHAAKPTACKLIIPAKYGEQLEEIYKAIAKALEPWPGCSIQK